MSNNQDDGTMHDQVSDAYRGFSKERAPDSLNRKILAMAAADVDTPRQALSFLASWTRPLAVAATVALSLAVVLQFTDVPDTVVPAAEAPLTLEEEFRPKDTSALEDARNQARLRAGPDRNDETVLRQDTGDAPEARQETADIPADTDTSNAPVLQQQRAARPPEQPASPAAARTASPQPSAAEPATASRDAAASSAFTSFSVSKEKLALDAERNCDDSREAAEDWLACIDELRLAGDDALADAEYQQYLRRFPVE